MKPSSQLHMQYKNNWYDDYAWKEVDERRRVFNALIQRLSRGIEKNNMEYLSGSKLELGDSRI
jgi:hypothetical protein